jgi:hypothetical protein
MGWNIERRPLRGVAVRAIGAVRTCLLFLLLYKRAIYTALRPDLARLNVRLNSINRSIFVMESQCVYGEVGN